MAVMVFSLACGVFAQEGPPDDEEQQKKAEEEARRQEMLKQEFRARLSELREKLSDESRPVRDAAVEEIAKIAKVEVVREKAVELLLVALNDDEPGVCRASIEALTELGAKKAVDPLRKIWKEDNNKSVRIAAAFAVSKMAEDTEAFDSIIEALKDEEAEVRAYAAELLGKAGSEKTAEPLAELLKDPDEDVCRAAAASLVKIGKPSVKYLIEALKAEQAYTRLAAARALGEIGDPDASDPLMALLKDSGKDVRRAAVRALAGIAGDNAVKPLAEALKDEDEEVRRLAGDALVAIGKPAVAPLIEMLKDKDIIIRFNAAKTLEKITGRDFGIDAEKWTEWWQASKNK
jgi:HEAT repeat protein